MKQMKKYGIRKAKAQLSELVRAAAKGECAIVTDNREPVAMIGPLPTEAVEAASSPPPSAEETKPLSDAAAFRKALLGAPYSLELDF